MVGGTANATKPQGMEVGRGGSPRTWEVVSENGVNGEGPARKPHTSTTRISVPTSVILWGPPMAQGAGVGSHIHQTALQMEPGLGLGRKESFYLG